MAQILKYVIGKDYRPLTVLEAKGGNTFTPDYDKTNWVQARQYEDNLRQVFVEITNEDGSAYDLTGANVLFEGILPDNEHKILDNSHVVFYEDPTTGKFRFDMPAQAFSVAGQYKQAFFRVVKDYRNIATLEFKFEVLADMVVTGMVARDYISPLEEFFNAIKDEQIKDSAELKKIVDDKINEITNLMTALNQTNTATLIELNSAKAAVEALQDKIKQDGLFTQGEAEEFKQNTLTSVNNAISKYTDYEKVVDDITSDDGVDNVVNDLTFFSKSLNQDKFNVLFLTDIHWTLMANDSDTNYATAGPKAIQQMMNTTVFDENVDAVVVNGDNIHGNEFGTSKVPQNINRTKEFVGILNSTFIDTDVFVNMGNHDNGTVWSTAPSAVISQDDLVKFYGVDKAKFGETRNKFLAYKDYDSKKIRVITMNTFDNPDVLDDNGKIKYPTGKFSIFTNSQIQSLVRALQTVPDDYHVLVFTHQPLEGYFGNRPYDYMTNINHDVVKTILQGFATHTNVSITGVNPEFATSVAADFTQNKGTLIGVVSGHEHRDDTVQSQNGVNGFLRTCFISVGQDRTVGESTQYAFDVIEVDHDNRRITFKRFGKGDDYSYGY